MFFQLLLPVAAICLVLAILKINIDPSSPTITLDFPTLLQSAAVAAANLPAALAPCAAAATGEAGAGACGGGLLFRRVAPVTQSLFWLHSNVPHLYIIPYT